MSSSKILDEHIVVENIIKLLRDSNALLLLPGGSASVIGIEALKRMSDEERQGITVSLTDERVGPVGHPDSNWKQLVELGIPSTGSLIPVLIDQDAETTRLMWEQKLQEVIASDKMIVALLGVGNDYHTAGLKPHYQFADSDLTVHYEAEDYERISIGPAMFPLMDHAIVYASGPDKRLVPVAFHEDNDPTVEPMQLVKQAKNYILYYREQP